MLLNLRQVTFGYGSPLAKPLDMEVQAGQVVALVGENGSGKSTLLKTLGGMLLPLDGSLELEGRPLAGTVQEGGAGPYGACGPCRDDGP